MCAKEVKPNNANCLENCKGLLVSSFEKRKNTDNEDFISQFNEVYYKYKNIAIFPPSWKGNKEIDDQFGWDNN